MQEPVPSGGYLRQRLHGTVRCQRQHDNRTVLFNARSLPRRLPPTPHKPIHPRLHLAVFIVRHNAT